jgi:hypothetical protein
MINNSYYLFTHIEARDSKVENQSGASDGSNKLLLKSLGVQRKIIRTVYIIGACRKELMQKFLTPHLVCSGC